MKLNDIGTVDFLILALEFWFYVVRNHSIGETTTRRSPTKSKVITPPKINVEPKKSPNWKGTSSSKPASWGSKMSIFQGASILMFLLMAHFLNPEVGGGMSPRCLKKRWGDHGLPLEFSCWRSRAVRSKINCLWSCWVLVEDRNPSQESSAKNAMEPLMARGSKKEAGARNQNFTHENQQMSPKWKGTILHKRKQLIFQCLPSMNFQLTCSFLEFYTSQIFMVTNLRPLGMVTQNARNNLCLGIVR